MWRVIIRCSRWTFIEGERVVGRVQLKNGVVLVDWFWDWVVSLEAMPIRLWQLLGVEGRKGALPYIRGELEEFQASISKRIG